MNVDAVQDRVRAHWDRQPCDSETSRHEPLSREFFLEVERRRYALQPHILELLARLDWRGKRVLEVGAGLGTDGRRLMRLGARYIGINIDRGSTYAAAQGFRIFSMPGVSLERDARALDFPDATFDVIYSFGVLQHIPDVERAVAEIARVLKPGGEMLLMVYNRASINYRIEICVLRRFGLKLLRIPGCIGLLALLGLPRATLERHRQLDRERGAVSEQEWLARNTNGPDYPYCRVYSAHEVERLLWRFEILSNEARFFDHRHWGVLGRLLPQPVRTALGRRWGWHRVVHARKPLGGARPVDATR